MSRNLNDRVEILFPIEDINILQRIKNILKLYLKDNVKAHMLQSNGTYRRITNAKQVKTNAQQSLYALAKKNVIKQPLSLNTKLKPLYHRDNKY